MFVCLSRLVYKAVRCVSVHGKEHARPCVSATRPPMCSSHQALSTLSHLHKTRVSGLMCRLAREALSPL